MNGLPQFGPNPFLMYPPIPGAFPFYPPGMLTDYPFLFPMSHILANKMLSTWEQLKFKSYFDEQPLDLSVDRNRMESGGNLQEEYTDVVGVEDKQHYGPLNLATSSVVRPIPLYPVNLEISSNIQSQPIKQQKTLFNENFQPSGIFKFVTKTLEEVAEVKPPKTTLQDPEVHQQTTQQTEIKTNENKHYCKICDKRFTKAASLKRHLKIHTTEQILFKCPTCDRQFSTSLGLFRHIKSQHKVNLELPETD